jgi:hypothetical protein
MRSVQKSFPLLYKVVLHYKIIATCNTSHNSTVSSVIKQLGTLKEFFISLLVRFRSLLHSSDIWLHWLEGLKSGSMGIQERLGRNFFLSYICPKPFYCSWHRIPSFLWSQPNDCTIAEIQSACSFLWIHSEFEYHSFISSYNGYETSFGRLWNCKAAEVYETWRGTVHSRVLQEVPYKGEIRVDDWEGGLYIHQADNNKKGTYMKFYYI